MDQVQLFLYIDYTGALQQGCIHSIKVQGKGLGWFESFHLFLFRILGEGLGWFESFHPRLVPSLRRGSRWFEDGKSFHPRLVCFTRIIEGVPKYQYKNMYGRSNFQHLKFLSVFVPKGYSEKLDFSIPCSSSPQLHNSQSPSKKN